jgi:serum/glucocorticoid-regulated kinase 2
MDADDTEVKNSMLGGKNLYTRDENSNAKLDDFKILKLIGKGTFGKVFLVEQSTKPGKMYAMKCIRKDIIIENE